MNDEELMLRQLQAEKEYSPLAAPRYNIMPPALPSNNSAVNVVPACRTTKLVIADQIIVIEHTGDILITVKNNEQVS